MPAHRPGGRPPQLGHRDWAPPALVLLRLRLLRSDLQVPACGACLPEGELPAFSAASLLACLAHITLHCSSSSVDEIGYLRLPKQQ